MKNLLSIIGLSVVVLLVSCGEKHFLNDTAYRTQVHEQFEKRKIEAAGRHSELFSILEDKSLTTEQREAMEFLYAYMPLSDLADYNGEFFLNQVNAAFKARDFFPWGKTIPDEIFRHFVLVYRINNENLDTARTVFFDELKDRVKDLSMYDAALEVNYWCHEKVVYRGTDSRTSAPLALVRTSWGRCGEESTFTTTALRAVGIPARQCYTPRWVHTDDNHAWVEVWVDGEWHFLGACEPAKELDVAWFTGPATRAMMVHTNVFGVYNGPEEKNLETPLYSKINLLENYTQTRNVKVQVVDENDKPVEGATVQFQVYNYAEMYPISTNKTGKDGYTSILSGEGDLLIWANVKDTYGYSKSEPGSEITVVKLNHKPGEAYEEDFVMNVPAGGQIKKPSSERVSKIKTNSAIGDSIRNAYMKTFPTQEIADKWAETENLDKEKVWKFLKSAQGNWQEIQNFIVKEKNNPDLFPFLAALSEKDLRDTPAAYLSDHLQKKADIKVKNGTPDDVIVPYIMSPRIENELIQPWRNFFQHIIGEEDMGAARETVRYIVDFVKERIKINDEENYYNCKITPRGVYELQIADRGSRNIAFVAACRSFGIPARVETTTGKPQYLEDNQWIDVVFEKEESNVSNLPKVKVGMQNDANNTIKPSYSRHYSLGYFKDGDFHTLDFEDNRSVSEFPYQLDLDEGYYRLMIGSRANDGSVTIHTRYFELKKDNPLTLTIKIPEPDNKLLVKGIIDMNTAITLDDNTKTDLKALSNGKGLALCFIDPDKEPSKHILQDLPAVQKDLEEWNGGLLLVVPGDKVSKAFDISLFKGLPKQTQWSTDKTREFLNTVTGTLKIDLGDNFPLTLYISDNGGVLYTSTGYKIGTGEDILKIIKKEALTKK
jgi:transglutaminase-like putative cysteine protease